MTTVVKVFSYSHRIGSMYNESVNESVQKYISSHAQVGYRVKKITPVATSNDGHLALTVVMEKNLGSQN